MIHRIFSNLPIFKGLEFKPGLNVLVAQKEEGASEKQTRNRAGKTSLIEIIHFLTGSEAGKESQFRSAALANETFGMKFELAGQPMSIERSGHQKAKVHVEGADFLNGKSRLSNTEWIELLSEKMFGLHAIPEVDGRKATCRCAGAGETSS